MNNTNVFSGPCPEGGFGVAQARTEILLATSTAAQDPKL